MNIVFLPPLGGPACEIAKCLQMPKLTHDTFVLNHSSKCHLPLQRYCVSMQGQPQNRMPLVHKCMEAPKY